MAATKSRPRSGSRNNGTVPAAADAARKAGTPALTAGAAAAGLAGGLLLGVRVGAGAGRLGRRRTVLAGAKGVAAAVIKASHTADDIHAIRQQLEQANKRSPIEVVLDGLTHRPGTRRRRRGLG